MRPTKDTSGQRAMRKSYLVCFPDLLPDADEFVRLHGEAVEADVGGADADIGQLERRKETVSNEERRGEVDQQMCLHSAPYVWPTNRKGVMRTFRHTLAGKRAPRATSRRVSTPPSFLKDTS